MGDVGVTQYRDMALLNFVLVDALRKRTGVPYLQVRRANFNLNAAGKVAVIAVGKGIDNGFAYRLFWVHGDVFALIISAAKACARWRIAHHKGNQLLDHLGHWTIEVL